MPGTIKSTVQIENTFGNFGPDPNKPAQVTTVQNNRGIHRTIVSVPTSEADLAVGSISTPGLITLRPLETGANVVTYGPKVAGVMEAFAELKAGDPMAYFRLKAGETLRWVASPATSPVEVTVYEN